MEEWGIETYSGILNPKQVSSLLPLLLSANIHVAVEADGPSLLCDTLKVISAYETKQVFHNY